MLTIAAVLLRSRLSAELHWRHCTFVRKGFQWLWRSVTVFSRRRDWPY